jgi:hypothetical protein
MAGWVVDWSISSIPYLLYKFQGQTYLIFETRHLQATHSNLYSLLPNILFFFPEGK